MGVRFQCPNGHKLHVKAELAGRRGVCPECGTKFVVPSFSGGRVAADAGGPAAGSTVMPAAPSSTASATSSTAAAPAPASSGPTDSIYIQTQTPPPAPVDAAELAPSSEAVAWYVRPAGGGQFGPASTEVFQQWIEDGRVAVDSWVWRTGWADWKAGSEALALLADRPPLEPVAAMAAVLDVSASAAPGGVMGGAELGSAEARRAEIKRRKQRVRMISTVLALVALGMLMALVFVLAR